MEMLIVSAHLVPGNNATEAEQVVCITSKHHKVKEFDKLMVVIRIVAYNKYKESLTKNKKNN